MDGFVVYLKNIAVNGPFLDSDIFPIYSSNMDINKTGRGRPRKDASSAKSESILLRMAPAEKIAFKEAANLAGLPLSAWVRERLRLTARRELEESGKPIAFLS